MITGARPELIIRLRAAFPLEPSFDDDSPLLTSGIIDSLSVYDLVRIVEEVSGREVPVEDITIDNFDSIRQILRYLDASAS